MQQASQLHDQQGIDARLREYEALLEEKSEAIRQLHEELQNAHSIVAEMEAQVNAVVEQRPPAGLLREEELLALSEELESERRQLQEDEQTLMQQMREMEVSMARERAEMARQRNDLNRLQSEIRHELERLEKSGAAVRKMEELKRQFADATTRRGLAASSSTNNAAAQPQAPTATPATASQERQQHHGQTVRGRQIIKPRLFLPSPLGGEGLGVRGKAAPSPPTPLPRGARGAKSAIPALLSASAACRRG